MEKVVLALDILHSKPLDSEQTQLTQQMKQLTPLKLGLAALLFGGTLLSTAFLLEQQPLQAERVQPAQQTLVARSEVPEGAALTLDDLPAGFTEIPPMMQEQLATQFQMLGQQFGPQDLELENFFVFVNPANFQVVMGFTGDLPTDSEQSQFDANLTRMENPEVQEQVLAQMQEKLGSMEGVEINSYAPLSGLNDVADASTGMMLEMTMQGQPFRVDMASFRRSSVGAFTAVMYPASSDALGVKTLADKLDNRILGQ
ncbi:MAG: hypothetical protein SW833_05715 [Cyanobacteriota bacterium]|nr:hypothetical protein [Cyanobacteriota bacterium]